MQKVLITRKIPKNGIEILNQYFDVDINEENKDLTYEEISERAKGCFGIISMVSDNIDKKLMDSAEVLKIIANYGVGFNNIDIKHATSMGIFVTNTPDVLTQSTAELGWSLIMAASRRISEADSFVRKGQFNGFAPTLMLGKELYGAKLGIIGMGRIGSTIARIARYGFNMDVAYCNRSKSRSENIVDAEKIKLDQLLKMSDVIVVTCSLNEDSKYLISYDEFKLMKKNAVFVNISRGAVVSTKALIKAVKNNMIFSCGLDVYENEPDIDEDLLRMPNCILLPHIGSATYSAREKMAEIVANNVVSVYKGRRPDNLLNEEAYGV